MHNTTLIAKYDSISNSGSFQLGRIFYEKYTIQVDTILKSITDSLDKMNIAEIYSFNIDDVHTHHISQYFSHVEPDDDSVFLSGTMFTSDRNNDSEQWFSD